MISVANINFAVRLKLILEEWHHDHNQRYWNAWKSNKNDSSEYKMPTHQCLATHPTQIYPNEDDFYICKQFLSDFIFHSY
jgi:hypothetical protein